MSGCRFVAAGAMQCKRKPNHSHAKLKQRLHPLRTMDFMYPYGSQYTLFRDKECDGGAVYVHQHRPLRKAGPDVRHLHTSH
jgi:hypothetical protein